MKKSFTIALLSFFIPSLYGHESLQDFASRAISVANTYKSVYGYASHDDIFTRHYNTLEGVSKAEDPSSSEILEVLRNALCGLSMSMGCIEENPFSFADQVDFHHLNIGLQELHVFVAKSIVDTKGQKNEAQASLSRSQLLALRNARNSRKITHSRGRTLKSNNQKKSDTYFTCVGFSSRS